MDYIPEQDDTLKTVLRLLKEYYTKGDAFTCIPTFIVDRCISILEMKISSKEDRYDYLR